MVMKLMMVMMMTLVLGGMTAALKNRDGCEGKKDKYGTQKDNGVRGTLKLTVCPMIPSISTMALQVGPHEDTHGKKREHQYFETATIPAVAVICGIAFIPPPPNAYVSACIFLCKTYTAHLRYGYHLLNQSRCEYNSYSSYPIRIQGHGTVTIPPNLLNSKS